MAAVNIMQTSPAAHAQVHEAIKWEVINDMNMAVQYASHDVEAARKQVLAVADVSCLIRYGIKGPQAIAWLQTRNIVVPPQANQWVFNDRTSLVLRLGNTEFLIEDQLDGVTCAQLCSDNARVEQVYPVLRADAAFIVSGRASLELFSEISALDLSEKALAKHAVIMTQIAGISTTIIRMQLNNEPIYRIWCDGTYGVYLWQVLVEIAKELGGGPVGLGLYQS